MYAPLQTFLGNIDIQKRWFKVMVLFLGCLVLYIILGKMTLPGHVKLNISGWQPYTFQKFRDKDWFQKTCIQGIVPKALEDLPAMIEDWRNTANLECRRIYLNFIKLLKVVADKGNIVIPSNFVPKVKSWLGNNENAFLGVHKQSKDNIRWYKNDLKHQSIISLYNRYTREENIFNPLRSKRPVAVLAKPEREYIDELAKLTQPDCDFCKYKDFTAEDIFGRVENVLSFSASNTFKLDRWHALFMLKTHHPLNWTKEDFMDVMDTKRKWFDLVYKNDSSYKYPSLVWDLLPHAGASQVHPHLHGFMDKQSYQGTMELWRRAALEYQQDFPDHNYFIDMTELYSILGLTVTHGKAIAFANLVPKKDNEIVIISETADEDFYLLWYYVIRGFLDDMGSGSLCFSSGIAFPSMSGDTSADSLPAYVRIVTRGPVADVRSDVSSLELFTAVNANTDPFQVIEKILHSVKKRSSKS